MVARAGHVLTAVALAITIIGIPFAWGHINWQALRFGRSGRRRSSPRMLPRGGMVLTRRIADARARRSVGVIGEAPSGQCRMPHRSGGSKPPRVAGCFSARAGRNGFNDFLHAGLMGYALGGVRRVHGRR